MSPPFAADTDKYSPDVQVLNPAELNSKYTLVTFGSVEKITKVEQSVRHGALLLDFNMFPPEERDMDTPDATRWVQKYMCANLDLTANTIWIEEDKYAMILDSLPQ